MIDPDKQRIPLNLSWNDGVILLFLLYYPWKIVCNTILYMIFQYG